MLRNSLKDTVADAEKHVRRALDTLSLPWDNQVLNYRQRVLDTKRVTNPTYTAVAEPIYAWPIGDGNTTNSCSTLG